MNDLVIRSVPMRIPLSLALVLSSACVSYGTAVKPAKPVDVYVTVDPTARDFDRDLVDSTSFIAPPEYLDACPATPTPLPPRQRSVLTRAEAIGRSSLRWPRDLCRCLLDARGASPYLRGPAVLNFSLEVRGSDRPRVPDRVSFEGESPYQPCLEPYLRGRPLPAGPGPLRVGFKIEVHESFETRRLHDTLQTVRLDFVECYNDAPRPHASVDVRWVVDPLGRADEIKVPTSKLGTCIERILSRLTFDTCEGCLAQFEVLPP